MSRQQRRAAAKRSPSANPRAADLFASAISHHQDGRLAEAAAGYRGALAAQPDYPDAAFNLGVALRQLGKIDEAIAAYRQVLCIKPDYPEAHYNLGNALMVGGKVDGAIDAYIQALRIKPDHVRAAANLGAAYSRLGAVLMARGNLDEAVAAFAQALALKSDMAEAHYNLGNVLKLQGKLDAAAAAYTRALGIDPGLAEAYSNLGNTLAALGRFDDAAAAHAGAIALKPASAEMHFNLGNAMKDQGRFTAAVDAYAQALRLNPDHAEANANLGIVLMSKGRLDEAVVAYRRAIFLKPDDADKFSNLLFCLNYDDSQTPAQLLTAHREWDERYGAHAPRPDVYANDGAPERRLKVGYVSPDFRTHSVAYFLAPLFENRNPQSTEVFCYADVVQPDAVTAHLRSLADHWVSAVGMTDDTLAERIQADGIDVLIDLAGHTAGNRLRVFARKPAPVQVTWLGYSNTTGLRAIDYRIVDDVTDPAGADAFASEMLFRLAGGFLCYGGVTAAPQPIPPPSLKSGAITFGSFNNPAKLSASTFDVWAKLLSRLPNARLLLKGKPFADEVTCMSFLARLGKRGIAAERVQLVAWLPSSAAHLALYEQIDIALDPFPYNGTTTTCEALWMGIPVVTLRGDRHASRVGASLLTQAGLTDWIAGSVDEYAEIALTLAADSEQLRALRGSLRQRVMASPMCDGRDFSRRIESACRAMWRGWCEKKSVG